METRETVAVCVKCGLSHGNLYGVVDHDSASGYAVKYSNNHDGRAIGCETGNDNIGSLYPYADQYTHSYNKDTDTYSLSVTYKGNLNLTWETNQSLNFGADFELLNGYLNGSLDIYSQTTKDLLYAKSVPLSSGNPTGYENVNVGSLNNKGIELSLDGNIIANKNVVWNWNANFSHNKNKILELDPSVSKDGIKGSYRIVREGGSLYRQLLEGHQV